MEFHLFLPQMKMSIDDLVARATAAEEAGFTGMALMDHLAPPFALDQPMYDAIVTATWLAARTSRLTLGHLVLCDAMRHPAILAKQAVSLDHASQGRFELGIGWGSEPAELHTYGIAPTAARDRVDRLAETLEVVNRLWSGERVDFEGTHHAIDGGQQLPVPIDRIPIVIGGVGPRTLQLVARHADWWNVPVTDVARLDELRPAVGRARVSAQVFVTLVTDETRRDEIVATAQRRFGRKLLSTALVGSPAEVVDGVDDLRRRGVERCYTWFTDFAPPETLHEFGAEVISAFNR